MLILLIVEFTYPPTKHFKFITKCVLLQIPTACLLQSAASGITMCDNFIITKVRLKAGHNIVVTYIEILNICRPYYSS